MLTIEPNSLYYVSGWKNRFILISDEKMVTLKVKYIEELKQVMVF